MELADQTPGTGSSAAIVRREPTGEDHCSECGLGPEPLDLDMWGKSFELSARKGCRACAAILNFLSGAHQNGVNSIDYCRDEPQPVLAAHVGIGAYTGYEFFIEKDKCAGRNSWVEGHPLITEMPKSSGNTSSMAAFSTLARWISRCRADHPLCKSAIETSLPHRVLEIQSLRPRRVRVVENCLLRARYACLSHRWGPQTEAKSLKTHNLDLYKRGLSEDNFYPLIEDAIEAAFRLGLRYIWIDSYCILQDELSDWEKEAANMASIYENAFLTISATSSEGGSGMFLTAAPESLGAKVTEVNGAPVFIRRQLEHPCAFDCHGREVLSGVTLDRAWVFQERLLSKRFIHFTNDELIWECQQSTWCECESWSSYWAWQRRMFPRNIQNQSWPNIAREYNKTKLTYEDDRLPALAGVARRYGELYGNTYLAGLWKEHLPSSLLWFKTFENRPEPRPLHQVAPTWSWLSLPRAKNLNLPAITTGIFVHIVGYDRRAPGCDTYTDGKHTEITVEGFVLDMTIYIQHHPLGDLIGKVDNTFVSLNAEFDMDPEDSTRYRSVLNGTPGVLLRFQDYFPGQSSELQLVGILLLPSSETGSQGTKFERVGHLSNKGVRCSHLDVSGEFTSYCGGRFPPFERTENRRHLLVSPQWLTERAEKRQLTLI